MTGAATAAERLPRGSGGITIALCIAEVFGMAGVLQLRRPAPGLLARLGAQQYRGGLAVLGAGVALGPLAFLLLKPRLPGIAPPAR